LRRVANQRSSPPEFTQLERQLQSCDASESTDLMESNQIEIHL
jgi:hypothetical protein